MTRNPDDMINTPAFKKWFGNSVVRDHRKSGEPLVVYHGAPDARSIYDTGFRASPMRGSVFFATDSQAVAQTYANAHRAFDFQNADPGVVPLYLRIENPMVLDAGGAVWQDTAKWVEKARKDGCDGVVIFNSRDTYTDAKKGPASTVYVWFDPAQAKSAATGPIPQSGVGAIPGENIRGSGPNRGTFDPHDPDIRKNPSRTFIPPPDVAAEARRGLELRAKQPPSNRCCTPVGLRRASQLANRQPVSVETLRRMRSYFQRHAVDNRSPRWGDDSKGWQAWLVWGGDAGRKWCNHILDRLGQ